MCLLETYKVKEYTIFGSDDSSDLDVMFYLDELPELQICRHIALDAVKLIDSSKEIDVNLCSVKNGVVFESMKGTVDEVNNMMFYTRQLHTQPYGKKVFTTVERNVNAKVARVMRGILSFISRTQYRSVVKPALSGNAYTKIDALRSVDLSELTVLGKDKLCIEDLYKLFAFQIGQCMPLIQSGLELYTKKDIVNEMPSLEPYLYRRSTSFPDIDVYKNQFLDLVSIKLDIHRIVE